jgi:lysophospholipase L1-like esterase
MKPLSFALAALLLAPAVTAQAQNARRGPEVFAPEIARFAEADQAGRPAPCQVLFVGSSSIRRWATLANDMSPVPVINRGFGGSTIGDIDFYFDKVVAPYHPRAIFFYAGDNDIAAGKTPAETVADFQRFLDLKDKALGKTPVWFISVKPSKRRWEMMPQMAEVNAGVRKLAAQRADLKFIDVVTPMLQDGQPKEIFVADGLHMTPEGYAIWTRVIHPEAEAAAKAPCRG